MSTFPLPGEFTATGLPHSLETFSAYMLLRRDPRFASETLSTPALDTCRRLVAAGETDPALLAAAITVQLPTTAQPLIRRCLGEEAGAIGRAFRRHVASRLTYIDQAPQPVQKLALAFSANGLARLQDHGTRMLEQLQRASADPDSEEAVLSLLPDPRGYWLILNKIRPGDSGNAMLEDGLRSALVDYVPFRRDYLAQLRDLPRLPDDMVAIIDRALDEDLARDYPDLIETAILPEGAPAAAWRFLRNDCRINKDSLHAARTIGELLTAAGDVAPDTIAAAMLGTGLGGITQDDLYFMDVWCTPGTMAILHEHTQALMQNRGDLMQVSVPVRQIALAGQSLHLRDGIQLVARIHQKLNDGELADTAMGRQVAARMLMPLGGALQGMDRVLRPMLGKLGAGRIEHIVQMQLDEAARGFGVLQARLQGNPPPQAEPPRRPGF